MANWSITPEERAYLRELAKKQLSYSQLPIMKEREERWYLHNDLKGEIPIVNFETWTCEKELLPELKCRSEAARSIELDLVRNILNHEMVDDDRVVQPWFDVHWHMGMRLFDHQIEVEHAQDSEGRDLGHQFKYLINDLPTDMKLLKPTIFNIDRETSQQWKTFVEEIFGDILPVRMTSGSPGASLTQNIVHLMGMETMIYSLVDYPDELHELMSRLTEDHIRFFKWREQESLLHLNNGNHWVCQNTFGFTHDLPSAECDAQKGVATRDLWLYMDSQETVSISPGMFHEFFFPYYRKIAEMFGLLSYGCCEPVHPVWEKSVSKLPNLRKVSISPWCDEDFMGEALRGSRIIYHRKPSPNFIGVGRYLDEEAFRAHILKTLTSAMGCKLEFSFRDVYTLGGETDKPRKAVKIVREMIEKYWK